MKLRILTLLFCLGIPFQVLNADIATDLGAKLPLEVVLKNAIAEGKTIEQAVAEMLALAPTRAENIVKAAIGIAPTKAGDIVAAAVSSATTLTPPDAKTDIIVDDIVAAIVAAAITVAPDQSATIVTAANSVTPNYQDTISQSAIGAGADPGVVTAATAAGIAAPTAAPAAPTAAPSAGGGGVASPS